MWRRLAMVTAVAMMAIGCGSSEPEVRERPEDCQDYQYFDEGQERCRSCPAAYQPECKPGCGFDIEFDERGCPILWCEAGCEGCEEGKQWDGQHERCEPVD